jgi:hypothetical protein
MELDLLGCCELIVWRRALCMLTLWSTAPSQGEMLAIGLGLAAPLTARKHQMACRSLIQIQNLGAWAEAELVASASK